MTMHAPTGESPPVFISARKALRLLTNSEAKTFRKCQRKHHYEYRLLRRPIKKAHALFFGTAFHAALEVWWRTVNLALALAAIKCDDPYDQARAEALMMGYHARWAREPLTVLAVEEEFLVPLINPDTGEEHAVFCIGGKKDAVTLDEHGQKLVGEHKTSGEDITPGSVYWRRLRIDTQVSTYLASDPDVFGCLYDVIKKPGLEPKLATPPEKRRYTKPKSKACPLCKKSEGPHTVDSLTCIEGRLVTDPGGKLHANQRETDETPGEYRQRILDDIEENLDEYFVRGTVVRLDAEAKAAARDLWDTASAILDAERRGSYPRNADACFEFKRACPYLGVCVGEESLDDDERFYTAPRAHEELEEKENGRVASESEDEPGAA